LDRNVIGGFLNLRYKSDITIIYYKSGILICWR